MKSYSAIFHRALLKNKPYLTFNKTCDLFFTQSAHSPFILRKASFRKMRFTTKVLNTTPKPPISIPLAHPFPQEVGKWPNPILIFNLSQVRFKSYFKGTIRFITRSAHSPAFSWKSFLSGKELHYKKKLGHNPKITQFRSTNPIKNRDTSL